MKPEKLSDQEVQRRLAGVPDWSLSGGQIGREYVFKDFVEAMRFVNRVADYAERAQHHPDITIRWNRVSLRVNTHDCAGISARDFELAHEVDRFT